MASGVLQVKAEHIVMTCDSAPSVPESVPLGLLGRTANGWVAWRNEDGETLRDVKTAISTVGEKPG